MTKRKLVLETGEEFHGEGFGNSREAVGEIVFNTSMVGYQEILSDTAYAGQIVVMTYPVIGQYGISDEDYESRHFSVAGMIVRECCDTPSNFRYTKTLYEAMEEHGIPCISGPDTRMITRAIRGKGGMRAAIVDDSMPLEKALELIASSPAPVRPADKVTCSHRWFKRTPHHSHDVVMVDCGLKMSIVDRLNEKGCNVTIVPLSASAEEIMRFNPDGVIISNGPGDPSELSDVVNTINSLKGKLPIAGIALGHQLIGMSYGAGIRRLPTGHHGGRPVRNLDDGRIVPVEHNHNFTVTMDCVSGDIRANWEDVVDGTVEGLISESDRVISCQFYPEGAPGPVEDSMFDKFTEWMTR